MGSKCWFAVAAVLLSAARATNAAPVTWAVGDGGNGHSYEAFVVPGGITWTAANSAAIAQGGTLATITSAAENQFVYDNVTSAPSAWIAGAQYHVGPWLGGFQDSADPGYSEPAGGWKWVTGEPFAFRPPSWTNNAYGSGVADENALHMINDFGFVPADAWNDYPAEMFPNPGRPKPVSYVVEYVPEPSALSALATICVFLVRGRR